jgi:hypothetical protein
MQRHSLRYLLFVGWVGIDYRVHHAMYYELDSTLTIFSICTGRAMKEDVGYGPLNPGTTPAVPGGKPYGRGCQRIYGCYRGGPPSTAP